MTRPFTIVFFHAHPDDESLLTAGTMARAAAEGHRVVLVVATAGEAGLAAGSPAAAELAATRIAEVGRAAAVLGCARCEVWDYADSGWGGTPRPDGFSQHDAEAPAERLAALLREERADVLTTYDPAGGYGHLDHVQVHRVGALAAQLAGTPVVLEATVDRARLQRALRLTGWLPGLPPEFAAERFASAFTARNALTHEVDVRGWTSHKRRAMAEHVSQRHADSSTRTLAVLLRLPGPLFRRALGREWYVERGRAAGGPLLDDVFASVRA